jgi:hypothetical protein
MAVILVKEARRDGFRRAYGGLAGLVAAIGVLLVMDSKD